MNRILPFKTISGKWTKNNLFYRQLSTTTCLRDSQSGSLTASAPLVTTTTQDFRQDKLIKPVAAVPDMVPRYFPDEIDLAAISGTPDLRAEGRRARIFVKAKAATQSGNNNTKVWRVELDNRERWESPLMGWCSSGDPVSNVGMNMKFASKEDAIAFCERGNWDYEVEEPQVAQIKPKSYGTNFCWNKKTRRMAMTYGKDMNTRPRYAPPQPSTVQRLLDDNSALIQSICELQSAGRLSEAAEYQQTLHRNLIYLASLAEDAQNLLAELQMPPDQVVPVSHPQAAEVNATVKTEPVEKNENKANSNQNSAIPTEQQIRIQHNPMASSNTGGNAYFNATETQPVMQPQYQQQQQQQAQPAVSAPPQQMQHIAQNTTTSSAQHPIAPVSSSIAVQQHVPPTTVYVQQQPGQQIYYHQQYQQGAPGQQIYGTMQQITHQQAGPRPIEQNATYYQHQPRYQQYQIYQQQQQQAPLQAQQSGQQQQYVPAPQQQQSQTIYATSTTSSHRPPYAQPNEMPQQQVTYAAYGQPPQQQMYVQQQAYAPPPPQQQQQQQPQS